MEDYKYYQEIHINCQKNGSMTPNLMAIASRPGSMFEMPASPLPIPFDMDLNRSASRRINETAAAATRFAAALMESKGLQPTQKRMSCSDAEPNTALLTAIIMLSTCLLAFLLKKVRESFYLGRQVSFLQCFNDRSFWMLCFH